MAAPQVKTVTDLLPADVQLRGQVSEILEDIHPRLADRTTPIPSIFKTGGAQELLQRLTAVESILSAADDYGLNMHTHMVTSVKRELSELVNRSGRKVFLLTGKVSCIGSQLVQAVIVIGD